MKPDQLPLKLPKKTPVIVVDPLNDFTHPKGVIARVYGAEDTKPLRDLLPVLNTMALKWKLNAEIILCRSLYRDNQFNVPGLENLCTEDNCWGRDSPIDSRLFHNEFEKQDNSILVTDDGEIRGILESVRFAVLTGMTLTSCIAASKAQIRKEIPDLTLVVPRDTTGVRVSRTEDGEMLFREWEAAEETRVIVTPSWRDVRFSQR